MKHWFWLLLSIGCIGWYLTITGYIAYRGLIDIKNMFKDLKKKNKA